MTIPRPTGEMLVPEADVVSDLIELFAESRSVILPTSNEDVVLEPCAVKALERLFSNDKFRFIAQLVTGLDELASYVKPPPEDVKSYIRLYGVASLVYERYTETIRRFR